MTGKTDFGRRFYAYMLAHPVHLHSPIKNSAFRCRALAAVSFAIVVVCLLLKLKAWVALVVGGVAVLGLFVAGFCAWWYRNPSHRVDKTGEFMQVPIVWWWIGGCLYLCASVFASKELLDWSAIVTGLIAGVMLLPWATEDEKGFGETARRMGGFFIVATFSLQLLAFSFGQREAAKQRQGTMHYATFSDELAAGSGLDPSKVISDSYGCLWKVSSEFQARLVPVPVTMKDGTIHQLCQDNH